MELVDPRLKANYDHNEMTLMASCASAVVRERSSQENDDVNLVYLRFMTEVGRTCAMNLMKKKKFHWELKVKPGKKEIAITQAR
nr:proline-rich receptor-like protein kinase PERK1 [Tanacetum cinerariifolium]